MTDTSPTPVKAPLAASATMRPWTISNIIDGRALRVKLTAIAQSMPGQTAEVRAAAKDVLHGALFRGRLIAQERLQAGADGLDTARLLSAVQDEVLSALYDFTTVHVFRSRNPTEGEKLVVYATGGYGRGVLAPSSDIDLLFLRQYKSSAWAESVIEYMLYMLWDMGLKVGHAFRTPEECLKLARTDVSTKTSMMDARFLFGDEPMAEMMRTRFQKELVEGKHAEFIADKIAERDARHVRQGATSYVVEPNVKEGPGGLRDLQTLFWITKHLYGGTELEDVMRSHAFSDHEYYVFMRAARFFWTVRCHLHYLTGRAEERISFDVQPELAKRLGYEDRPGRLGVERFMKRYFIAAKDVAGLSRILSAKLEAQHEKPGGLRGWWPWAGAKPIEDAPGFSATSDQIMVEGPEIFDEDPVRLLRLFQLAGKCELHIHPSALSAASRRVKALTADIRESEEAASTFLDILLGTDRPADLLRLMNEAGLLGRMVPEFGGIVAQTQFNMYHHFTVDEHTIRAIEVMSDLEHGRTDRSATATELFGDIENRRALYLAMLLHDTGKGKGDQQIAGMQTARAACRRLGLPAAETDLVAWLVGNHLEMSETAQKRDISDPSTVATFAQLVGSVERLSLLHILTVADISAVGPKVWNSWKGQLLDELHHNTEAALRGGRTDAKGIAAELEQRAEAAREALMADIGHVPELMARMEPAYWTGFDDNALAWHAAALGRSEAGPCADIRQREDADAVTLFIAGSDRVGLFAEMAGFLARIGANIVSAQVYTSGDGRFIDVFRLQDSQGGPFADGQPDRLEALAERALRVMAGEGVKIASVPRTSRREAAFLVEPSVQIFNDVSASFSVVDVTARDRIGLLYDVARVLAEEGLTIHSAHVGSYGERVFDAFYVQDAEGRKIEDQAAKWALKRRLLDVLGRDEPDAPRTPARGLAQAPAQDSF